MSSPHSDPSPGDVFAGKYRVERVLGRGGMGVVVAATHLVLGHEVALKFLMPTSAAPPETVARFLREARITARLKSPHVAKTLDVGQLEDGRPFLVMELLEGRDLGAEIEGRSALPVPDVVRWVLEACEGIAEAHAAGIVHRDLKPSNLFLARDPSGTPVVKVLDFGISKLSADVDDALTGSHATFGSPLYMSPEQLRSSKSTDARSDVWSLGVILYEGLCGEPPFRGETVFGVAQSVMVDTPRPLVSRRKGIPGGLSSAVMRCLAKRPHERTASVAVLAEELAPYAGPSGVARAARVRSALAAKDVDAFVDGTENARRGADAASDGVLSHARTSTPSKKLMAVAAGAVLVSGALAAWRLRPRPAVPIASMPVEEATEMPIPPTTTTTDERAGELSPRATARGAVSTSPPLVPTLPALGSSPKAGAARSAAPPSSAPTKSPAHQDKAVTVPPSPSTASDPFIDQRSN